MATKTLKKLEELTAEELANIAKTQLTEKEKPTEQLFPETDVHAFIIECKVRAGATKVPAAIVYATYREWCVEKKLKPRVRRHFFMVFSKLFKLTIATYTRVYHLDHSPFDLSDKAYRKILEQNSKQHQKNRYKKEQEISTCVDTKLEKIKRSLKRLPES